MQVCARATPPQGHRVATRGARWLNVTCAHGYGEQRLAVLLFMLAHWLSQGGALPSDAGSFDRARPVTSPVIAAAGDIACAPGELSTDRTCHHAGTASLLAGADRVLTLGDNQYETGALPDFRQAYGPTWGRYKAITEPVPGDEEYETPGALGYYDYFGKPWWYSYDIGAWHLIALDSSNRYLSQTSEGSPQNNWLEADLASHPNKCTLAYWHHPRYSATSSYTPGVRRSVAGPLWTDLLKAHADVVLNGHEHNYQRWAPMDNARNVRSKGIRQFVVGTGGKSLDDITKSPVGLQASSDDTFGVLRLTLHRASYNWAYVTEGGQVLDSGSGNCR